MQLNVEFLSVISALIMQAVGTVWWAATINNKVVGLYDRADTWDDRFAAIEDEQRSQDRALTSIGHLMSRLDERSEQMVRTMERVERRLDAAQSENHGART